MKHKKPIRKSFHHFCVSAFFYLINNCVSEIHARIVFYPAKKGWLRSGKHSRNLRHWRTGQYSLEHRGTNSHDESLLLKGSKTPHQKRNPDPVVSTTCVSNVGKVSVNTVQPCAPMVTKISLTPFASSWLAAAFKLLHPVRRNAFSSDIFITSQRGTASAITCFASNASSHRGGR